MQRIAAPTVGGLIRAPLPSMFVIPAAYLPTRRPEPSRAREWDLPLIEVKPGGVAWPHAGIRPAQESIMTSRTAWVIIWCVLTTVVTALVLLTLMHV